jgi:predicted lipid-binding transport protein (Tim44 family)
MPSGQSAGFESQPAAAQPASVPAGFDAAGFLRGAKMNFVKLQLANDAGNLEEIREFATPEMFDELSKDVSSRGAESQQTDVVTLNADLLEVVTEGAGAEQRHWASVRFSGMMRETRGAEPVGFEEVWNLVKPADGSSGWLLAGIQQMN